ncbi:carboxypeptidase-like regulatory domain-containing protein [Pilimelia anulata]|uniref:carboxypeptidase-like regulatory domain-containing protein n=1 Tax=Pilimelia anulata TaxID=53371 RepID=UPI0016688D85|nr:carboxypeptidase-like regulatory domain-containing protein [Pilimelia anulata]
MVTQSGRRRGGGVTTRLSLALGAFALGLSAPAAAAVAAPPEPIADSAAKLTGPVKSLPDLNAPELKGDKDSKGAASVLSTLPKELDCSDDGDWVFRIDGVGHRSKVPAPKFIVAKAAKGKPAFAKLASEERGAAYYSVPGEANLTGHAGAWISTAWKGTFTLIAAPCEAPTLTAESEPTLVVKGSKVFVSGKLTDADGAPVARHEITLESACSDRCRRYGKGDRGRHGKVLRAKTDRKGRYFFKLRPGEIGLHELTVRSAARAPEAGEPGLASATKTLGVWVVPHKKFHKSGELGSSKGDALIAGPKATVLTGDGFRPGSDVAILLYGEPTVITVVKADGEGRISVEVDLPADLRGEHRLVALGEDRRCRPRILIRKVTVQAPPTKPGGGGGGDTGTTDPEPQPEPSTKPVANTETDGSTLPVTGASLAGVLVGGGAIVAGGVGLRFLARRRRGATPLG